MATKPRKAPSANTLRELYVLSGNLCANPKCKTVIVNTNGTVVADVCHIKAEKPDGARYDKKLSEADRRASANLLLLCRTCHKLVDTEEAKYTVAILTKWKMDRERHFAAVGELLRQRYIQEITDEFATTDFTEPRSMKSFVKFLDLKGSTHSIDKSVPDEVAEYAKRLRKLSQPDRELMCAIVERALSLSRSDRYGISVHPDDLKTIIIDNKRLSDYRISKLANTLDRMQLGSLDADEEPRLYIAPPAEECRWSRISQFLSEREKDLRAVICDLQFGLLD